MLHASVIAAGTETAIYMCVVDRSTRRVHRERRSHCLLPLSLTCCRPHTRAGAHRGRQEGRGACEREDVDEPLLRDRCGGGGTTATTDPRPRPPTPNPPPDSEAPDRGQRSPGIRHSRLCSCSGPPRRRAAMLKTVPCHARNLPTCHPTPPHPPHLFPLTRYTLDDGRSG